MARLRHQIATTYGAEMVNIVSGLAFGIIVARALAPEGRGLMVAAWTAVTVSMMVSSFGLNKSLISRLNRPQDGLGSRDYYAALLISMPLVLALGVITLFVTLPTIPADIRPVILLILLAAIPASYVADIARVVMRARRKIMLLNALQAVTGVLRLAGVAFLWATDAISVRSALAVELFCVCFLALTALYHTRASWSRAPRFAQVKPALVSIVSYGVAFMAYSLSFNLINKVAILSTHRFGGDAATGLLAVGMRLAEYVGTFMNGILFVFTPYLATMATAHQAYAGGTQIMRLNVMALVPLGIAAAIAAPFFIPLLYGQAYAGSVDLFRLTLITVFASTMFQFSAMPAVALGHLKGLAACAATGLAFGTAAAFILVPRYGPIGAVTATVIGHGTAFMLNLLVLRVRHGVTFRQMLVPGVADVRLVLDRVGKKPGRTDSADAERPS